MTALLFCLDGLARTLRYVFLLVLPFRERLRLRGWRLAAALIAGTLLSAALTLGFYRLLPETPYARLWLSCFGLACSALFFFLTTRGPFFPLLFTLLLWACYGDNIGLIVQVADMSLTPGAISPLAGALWELALTAFTLPLLYAIVNGLLLPILDAGGGKSFWRLYWQIPAICYFIYRLAICPNYFPDGVPLSPPWSLLLLLWPLATTCVHFIILRLIRDMNGRLTLQSTLEENRALLALQETLCERLRAETEQSRVIRHDMRHHLRAIQSLLASGHSEEARRYLADYIRTLRPVPAGGDAPPERQKNTPP